MDNFEDPENYVEEDSKLSERQLAQKEMTESLAETFGLFSQDSGEDGAHYGPESPFQKDGLVCSSCIFFEGGHGCHVVEGEINPLGICKLWIIPETLVSAPKSAKSIGRAIGKSTVAKFNRSFAVASKQLYFRVVEDYAQCPKDKPYGVIGEKSGTLHGCHGSVASANAQLSSLYAATDPNSGYKPSAEDRKNLETPEQHTKRRNAEKKAGKK